METKSKQEICKNWELLGYCSYGKKCFYAHGKNELRKRSGLSSKYKVWKCAPFSISGYCRYGRRCCFNHSIA